MIQFHRFERWIKLQGLPKELEIYVMHVLNHLWENASDFSDKDDCLAIQCVKACGPDSWLKIKALLFET